MNRRSFFAVLAGFLTGRKLLSQPQQRLPFDWYVPQGLADDAYRELNEWPGKHLTVAQRTIGPEYFFIDETGIWVYPPLQRLSDAVGYCEARVAAMPETGTVEVVEVLKKIAPNLYTPLRQMRPTDLLPWQFRELRARWQLERKDLAGLQFTPRTRLG